MDFDEYEYLESTVENPELRKLEDKVNGGDGIDEDKEKGRTRGSKRRSHDDNDDLDGLSNRSKSRKESNEHEKDRRSNDHERERKSRHSSSGRDREKGDRDRHSNNREKGDRDRHSNRIRDKEEGSGRERNRDRGREREKDRERDGNRERREAEKQSNREEERERSMRSRSRSERHHDERGREASREKEILDKDSKEKRPEREFRGRGQENRRHKEKKEEGAEPEADPERDQRTVFAYQISLKAGEREVYEFFSRAGKVRDVQIIMDRNTRRSKGVGYIEFYDSMSVPMAIALSGQPLLGHPVMVKPSEAEKNLVQSTTAASGAGGIGPYSGGARRLYVGNLPVTIKEDQLRQVFEPFGAVELVQMPIEPGTGNCKGYAFIQFARLEDAKAAANLNGQLEIAGRVIKVSAITDQAGMQDAGANIADFDDDDGNALSLNAQSRALLMQKLDRTGTASSITGSSILGQTSTAVLPGLPATALSMPPLTTAPSIDTIGVPSECLLLKNMFDPTQEAEPEFDLDIKEDVEDECSKFGKLKHIYVEKNSAGLVYLRFENTEGSVAAQRALHGRWFAGKMITAHFMLPPDYEAKFRDSS